MTTKPCVRSSALAGRVVAVALAVFVAGCGGTPTPEPATGGIGESSLAVMGEMLHSFRGKPPKDKSDFKTYRTAYPDLVDAIQEGRLVYQYGAGIKPGSQAVLAYGKDTANAGGAVLLQDGTVKEMTAAEFAAAPKAGKN